MLLTFQIFVFKQTTSSTPRRTLAVDPRPQGRGLPRNKAFQDANFEDFPSCNDKLLVEVPQVLPLPDDQ